MKIIPKHLKKAREYDENEGVIVALERYQEMADDLFSFASFGDEDEGCVFLQRQFLEIFYSAQQALWEGITSIHDWCEGEQDEQKEVYKLILGIYEAWDLQKKLLDESKSINKTELPILQKHLTQDWGKYLVMDFPGRLELMMAISNTEIFDICKKQKPLELLYCLSHLTDRLKQNRNFMIDIDLYNKIIKLPAFGKKFKGVLPDEKWNKKFSVKTDEDIFSEKFLNFAKKRVDFLKVQLEYFLKAKEELLEIWSNFENLQKPRQSDFSNLDDKNKSKENNIIDTNAMKSIINTDTLKIKDFFDTTTLYIAVSGKMWLDRDKLKNEFLKFNIFIVDISKKAEFLLLGINPSEDKIQKAKDNDIPIIYLPDLLKLITFEK